ncbi:type II toxin-antitoxin system PemK/MazF family toxin [Mucilaginibacter arboris]|uniref:Type II toxin-antitoxin system PemK/MazF family toxin n=1 Tax=Mucilaginibacter arboris TaxID=2682090 RepID=A0A7K1SUD6_9SPHI|nr:type II toxin-antitoxin system PemK/MazF family toxin [Mucilaginibacter arboris]MVN20873.1 type II toxin-antitoxin system PemK/MazF family toxin [Mucilaginibacter arboris]
MVKEIQQYEIFWISLDPTQGSEMAKNRPCVVISPNEMNFFLRTLIIVPITSTIKNYPWRVSCIVANRAGSIATDQIKVVDRVRVGSKIGKLSIDEISALKDVIQKMLID